MCCRCKTLCCGSACWRHSGHCESGAIRGGDGLGFSSCSGCAQGSTGKAWHGYRFRWGFNFMESKGYCAFLKQYGSSVPNEAVPSGEL
eukprot:6245054-Amphidinium_carterae.1